MPPGGGPRRPGKKKELKTALLDGHVDERVVPSPYNLPSSDGGLPLRLLDNFTLFIVGDSGHEQPVGLEELHEGSIEGLALKARGTLLEHRAAAASLDDARASSRLRVRMRVVRDWVVDYSQPAALWICSETAWYRLLAPADDYTFFFRPALKRLALAVRAAEVVKGPLGVTYDEAVASITSGSWELDALSALDDPGADFDPYVYVEPVEVTHDDVIDTSEWLVRQLALFLGRHTSHCPFVTTLASHAGLNLEDIPQTGRRVRGLETGTPAADPTARPLPRTNFLLPEELQPLILTVWDFAQTYRQLLRLPPFPLVRLERAFLDVLEGEGEVAAEGGPDQASGPQVAATAVGAVGQARLIRDIHSALLRLLEGAPEGELQEPATLAGYGPAADVAPNDAYRPLLGVTWPELVRHALHDHSALSIGEAAYVAVRMLKAMDYEHMPGPDRLALLTALTHIAADTEVLRGHLAKEGAGSKAARRGPLGCDGSGACYYMLAGDSGGSRLFVEESGGGSWGWYAVEDLPPLIAWLEGGCDAEQALADELVDAFEPALIALAALPEDASPDERTEAVQGAKFLDPEDGYRLVRVEPSSDTILRKELLKLGSRARWFEKTSEWLQARAAVLATLQSAAGGPAFARLLWLIEDLIYDDLLKGTGWGRRRGWFREQLERCVTTSQAAVVAAQLIFHCRSGDDMGFASMEEFTARIREGNTPMPFLPAVDSEVVLLRTGYKMHKHQMRPPKDTHPLPLPASWREAEPCSVEEVATVRAAWQRPTWQGRFAGAGAYAMDPADVGVVIAWVLLQKKKPGVAKPEPVGEEIDWTNFSFGHGFRIPMFKPETALGAAGPNGVNPNGLAVKAEGDLKADPGSTWPSRAGVMHSHSTNSLGGIKHEESPEPPGGEEGEAGKMKTRSRRTGAGRFMELGMRNAAIVNQKAADEAAAKEAEEEDAARLAEEESIKFWSVERDFAAVGIYVRPNGTRVVQYLLQWSAYQAMVLRPWPQGLAVKMPSNSSLTEAIQNPQRFNWYSGYLLETFDPTAPGVDPATVDPWGALQICWDDAPKTWPTRMSPWQVIEDAGGVLRNVKQRKKLEEAAQKDRLKAEAAARDAQRDAMRRRQGEERQRSEAERMRNEASARKAQHEAATAAAREAIARAGPGGIAANGMPLGMPQHSPPNPAAMQAANLAAFKNMMQVAGVPNLANFMFPPQGAGGLHMPTNQQAQNVQQAVAAVQMQMALQQMAAQQQQQHHQQEQRPGGAGGGGGYDPGALARAAGMQQPQMTPSADPSGSPSEVNHRPR